MAVDYQGGNDTILTGFYGGINNAFARNQARLAKQAQDEATRRAAEQKELSDIVKKVNTNGVQKVDLPEMTSKLDDIYKTYYEANKAQTSADRIAKRLDLEKQISEFSAFNSSSRERGQRFVKIADEMATKPQLFSSQARQNYMANVDTPTSKLGVDDLSLNKYISPDTSVLDKTEDALVKNLWTRANEKMSYGKTQSVGATGDMVTSTTKTKSINPADIGVEIMRSYNNDAGYKNVIDYQAQQVGLSPQVYLVQRANELAKLNKPVTEQGQFRNSRPPKAGGSGDGDSFTGVVDTNYDINYGSKSDNKIGTITARESVALPTGTTLSAGKFNMVDANGNKYDSKNTTEELKLVRVATVPVLNRSVTETSTKGGKQISKNTLNKGAIVTKDYADKNPSAVTYQKKAIVVKTDKGIGGLPDDKITYFADPSEVIPRTKLTKAAKIALSAYENEYNNQKSNVKETVPKTKEVKVMGKVGNIR